MESAATPNYYNEEILLYNTLRVQATIRKFIIRARIMRDLASRYEKIYDPKRRRFYYYDQKTDSSTWIKPVLFLKKDLSVAATYSPDQAAAKIQRMVRSYLSKLKVRIMYQRIITTAFDEESGLTYYINPYVGSTMWELPPFMNDRLDYKEKPPRPLTIITKKKSKTNDDDDENDDESDEDEDEEDEKEEDDDSEALSESSEQVREKRRNRRKYPRSKIQTIVDTAEDNTYETLELDLSHLNAPYLSSRVYDLHELRALNISNNQLIRLSPNIQYLDKLEFLDASYNLIRSIPKEIEELTKLQDVRLPNNHLSTLPGQFYKLKQLTNLDLSNNNFTEVPLETGNLELLQETGEWEVGIGLLTSLKKLDFRHNQLQEWPVQLEKLIQLEELYLSYNKINEVSSDIGENTGLKVLQLSGNQIISLPSEIYLLINLEEFRAQQNHIRELPVFMPLVSSLSTKSRKSQKSQNTEGESTTSLRLLDLSQNELMEIGHRISHFTRLESIMLQHNRLQTLTIDCFTQNTALTYLDLSYNQLEEISPSLNVAVHLSYLDISHNNIKELPNSLFFRTTKLKVLKANHNLITDLNGKSIAMLNDLERMELQYNQIANLSTLIFTIKKLVYVDFSHNNIAILPPDIHTWSKLIYFDMCCNKLSLIPETIGECVNLTFLNFHHNEITLIPPSISKLHKLQHVYLHHNQLQLSSLHVEILSVLPQLQTLDLSWNIVADFAIDLGPSSLSSLPTSTTKEKSLTMIKTKLDRQIHKLMEKVDIYISQISQQEQLFLHENEPNNLHFSLLKSWFAKLRHHFTSSQSDNRELEVEEEKFAQELKSQTSKSDFNDILLLNLQKEKKRIENRQNCLFFWQLNAQLNRPVRYYKSFLEVVQDFKVEQIATEITSGKNADLDLCSHLFVGVEGYLLMEEIVQCMKDVNTLAIVEELLYQIDRYQVKPTPITASVALVELTKGRNPPPTEGGEDEAKLAEDHKQDDQQEQLPQAGRKKNRQSFLRSSQMFFASAINTLAKPLQSIRLSDREDLAAAAAKAVAAVNMKVTVEQLEVNIESNDLETVLCLMKDLVDVTHLLQSINRPISAEKEKKALEKDGHDSHRSHSKSRHRSHGHHSHHHRSTSPSTTSNKQVDDHHNSSKERERDDGSSLPFMTLPLAFARHQDHVNLSSFLSSNSQSSSSITSNKRTRKTNGEDPFGRSLFSLYFDINNILTKLVLSQVEVIQRAIRTLERENHTTDKKMSVLDLAQRDYFYLITSTSEAWERVEDYSDLLPDVYSVLMADKEEIDKKKSHVTLGRRHQLQVDSFFQEFLTKGGYEGLQEIVGVEFVNNPIRTSAVSSSNLTQPESSDNNINASQASLASSSSQQPDKSADLSTTSASTATRRSSQASLQLKLEKWKADLTNIPEQKFDFLQVDHELFDKHITFLSNLRFCLVGWAMQAVENNNLILSSRGIECSVDTQDFLRHMNVLRDPRDPSRINRESRKDLFGEDSIRAAQYIQSEIPANFALSLMHMTRVYLQLRAKTYQYYGFYGEAMRSYEGLLNSCHQKIGKSVFLDYIKSALCSGHYLKARELMQYVIRRFIMPPHKNELIDENEVELWKEVDILPIDREVAILFRFANMQAEALEKLGIYSTRNHYVHNVQQNGRLLPAAMHIVMPEVKYGRDINDKEKRQRIIVKEEKRIADRYGVDVRYEVMSKVKDIRESAKHILEDEKLQTILLNPLPPTAAASTAASAAASGNNTPISKSRQRN